MKNGLEVYQKIADDQKKRENHRLYFWMESILGDFPRMKKPAYLKSLDDCKSWFKDYKKEIKEKGVEWEYCRMTLVEFDEWESKMTKNRAYMKENALIVNLLYRHYVLGK